MANARRDVEANKVDARTFEALEQYISAHPQDPEAHVLLGQCYERIGMMGLAREQFMFIFNRKCNDEKAAFLSFTKKFASDDPGSSFPDWVQIYRRFPSDRNVRLLSATIDQIFGTVAKAEEKYVEVIDDRRSLPGIDAQLSLRESQRGNFKRALCLAKNELARQRSKEALLAEAIALNGLHRYKEALLPANSLFLARRTEGARQLAIAHAGLGDYQSALAPALMCVVLTSPTSPEMEQDRQLLARTLKHCSAQRLDASLAPLRNAYGRMGMLERMEMELAQCYLIAGMNEPASSAASRWQKLDPQSEQCRRLLEKLPKADKSAK